MPLAVVPLSLAFIALAVPGAGAMLALHYLRVQPTQKSVATLMFWRSAVRPQQARALWSRRVTHPKTLALLTTILLLIAAALTADRWGSVGAAEHRDVIVVDDGIAMAANDDAGHPLLKHAVDSARADLDAMWAAPALIAAGEQPLLLSRGDEPAAVVQRRLDMLAPGSGASAAGLALELARSVQGGLPGQVHWYTVLERLPAGLPGEVARRVRLHHIAPGAAVAIVGLAFEPNGDNASRGILIVSCAAGSSSGLSTGTIGAPIAASITVQAQVVGESAVTRPIKLNAGRAEVSFADLPADGRLVAIRLIGAPGPAQSQQATLQLPDQRPLTFHFVGNVPPALRAVALALGTESDRGRIAVVGPDSLVPGDVAAVITVVDQGEPIPTGERLVFAPDAPWGRGLSLEDSPALGPALGNALGPDLATPGVAVLTAGRATLASLAQTPARRTLYLSSGLVAPNADLPRRAAYPVLFERLCRELVDRSSPRSTIGALRAAQDPLWPGPPEMPHQSAPITLPDQPPSVVAAVAGSSDDAAAGPVAVTGPQIPWTEVVLGLALLLTILETILHANRRII